MLHAGADFMNDIKEVSKREIVLVSPVAKSQIVNNIRKILTRYLTKISGYWVKFYLRDCVKDREETYVVIVFDSPIWLNNIKTIQRFFPNSKIIVWYWNTIKCETLLNKVKKTSVPVYTFDKKDAQTHSIKLNTQFHWLKKESQYSSGITYDAVFIGRTKDRLKLIENVYSSLTKAGLNVYFHVVKDNINYKSEIITLQTKYLRYHEALEIVRVSRVIIDLNSIGQTGLSLRPLEAIFLQKKLVTNCVALREYSQESNDNVYYLSDNFEQDQDELINFMRKKFDDSIAISPDQFFVDSWLDNFIVPDNDQQST